MYSGKRPEAIELRLVFQGYAGVVGLSGFLLFGWGPMWFGVDLAGQPFGKAALVRVCGAVLIAAACCAAGFAAIDDPPSRRRGLFWFAAGHTVVWLVVLTQRIAIWGPGLADSVAKLSFAVAFLLFYLWATAEGEPLPQTLTTLFGSGREPAVKLRSQYEQQIREAARLEERNRLARDLHDSIKQQLFVIQTAAATAQARGESDREGAQRALEQVRDSAREAMAEMQAMLDQLAAAPLENRGLIEALKKHCEALGFRTGARVEFKLGDLPPSGALPPGAHEAILRAAQEALANVGRHARASNVAVSLGSAAGVVQLRVEDDGAGFDPEQANRGQGLANMRSRAEQYGGTFELATGPGRGTSVTFSILCERIDAPAAYLRKAVAIATLLALMVALFAREPSHS